MSGPGPEHQLVREYLRDVDAQLEQMRSERAAQLREQISTHLAALAPGADDAAVAAALAGLGSPSQLVAGAAGAGGRHRPTVGAWLAGLGWRRTAALSAGLALLIGAVVYYIVVQTATPLAFSGVSGWWFRQDQLRTTSAMADAHTQTTVPIRSGQWQGYYIGLVNQSDLTQTVLGPATGPGLPADSIGSPASPALISVNAPNRNVDNGSNDFTGVKFVLPGDIPPHQGRVIRVLWKSTVCLQGQGSATGNDELALRVRIGWIVRIEVIPLDQGWFLAGPSQGSCG